VCIPQNHTHKQQQQQQQQQQINQKQYFIVLLLKCQKKSGIEVSKAQYNSTQ